MRTTRNPAEGIYKQALSGGTTGGIAGGVGGLAAGYVLERLLNGDKKRNWVRSLSFLLAGGAAGAGLGYYAGNENGEGPGGAYGDADEPAWFRKAIGKLENKVPGSGWSSAGLTAAGSTAAVAGLNKLTGVGDRLTFGPVAANVRDTVKSRARLVNVFDTSNGTTKTVMLDGAGLFGSNPLKVGDTITTAQLSPLGKKLSGLEDTGNYVVKGIFDRTRFKPKGSGVLSRTGHGFYNAFHGGDSVTKALKESGGNVSGALSGVGDAYRRTKGFRGMFRGANLWINGGTAALSALLAALGKGGADWNASRYSYEK